MGDFDTTDYDWAQWTIFILASAINPIIMLNLLIAIMSDTYDKVQESVEVADNKELSEMILEVETMMFWKRNTSDVEYMQICVDDGENTSDSAW